MAQGSSAVHKTDSSSVNSFCTPAVIAGVSYFLHRRLYSHVPAAYLASKSRCASRKTGTSFFSDRDPQPENCAGGKFNTTFESLLGILFKEKWKEIVFK